jgi:hypothetical protein
MERRGFQLVMILYKKGVTLRNFRFERDLLSWRMAFNWSPMGTNSNWNFFIGIKSGMLSDIKWNKRNFKSISHFQLFYFD